MPAVATNRVRCRIAETAFTANPGCVHERMNLWKTGGKRVVAASRMIIVGFFRSLVYEISVKALEGKILALDAPIPVAISSLLTF